MKPAASHQSRLTYLPNVMILEETQGTTRLYPHTEQLPAISRAINLEFYGGLRPQIAKTDHRGDNLRKHLLRRVAGRFCDVIHEVREDDLTFAPVLTRDLVTKIAVVQRITESTAGGLRHSIRLFADKQFWPDIHLSGKRVTFASHILDRFTERLDHRFGRNFPLFMMSIFDSPAIVMQVNRGGDAVVLGFAPNSTIALTFQETESEFFFTTCLSVNEINDLQPSSPLRTLNFHYGSEFTEPKTRTENPEAWAQCYVEWWRQKNQPAYLEKENRAVYKSWNEAATRFESLAIQQWIEGTTFAFMDGVYGPGTCETTRRDPAIFFQSQLDRVLKRLPPVVLKILNEFWKRAPVVDPMTKEERPAPVFRVAEDWEKLSKGGLGGTTDGRFFILDKGMITGAPIEVSDTLIAHAICQAYLIATRGEHPKDDDTIATIIKSWGFDEIEIETWAAAQESNPQYPEATFYACRWKKRGCRPSDDNTHMKGIETIFAHQWIVIGDPPPMDSNIESIAKKKAILIARGVKPSPKQKSE